MHDERGRWVDPRRPQQPGPRRQYQQYQPLSGSEPGLVTHQYAPGGYETPQPAVEAPPQPSEKQRKQRRWKIIRRVAYALVGVFFVVPAVAFVITYFLVDVPSPADVAHSQSQAVTYFYADGSPMGKDVPSGGNRTLLTPDQIPDVVKHAVIATEDSTFETNSGFDVTGILRAVYNQVTGGSGGGSTISQQYIKKATDNDAPTLTRKWTELAKSFKMNQTYDKKDIITAYLNIIYFGRGAYGIGAASQAFFHKDVKDLDYSEAALLAGLIQQPGRSENEKVAHDRWNVALDRMLQNGYISQAQRTSAQFPTPIPLAEAQNQTGAPNAFIEQRVKDELAAHGIPEDKYYSGGFQVHTTIDPKAQQAAEQAATEAMQGQTDPNLLDALVAVDPKTGGVLAYYGGKPIVQVNGQDLAGRDWADLPQNPGSSMKAFDLTAFLKMGKGLDATFDGTSPRSFPGAPQPIRNAGPHSSCSPNCTVAEAMMRSANTVFYDMVLNVTKQEPVKEAAKEAGVKTKEDGGQSVIDTSNNNISLGGGKTAITPADMATAYATFAAGGQRHERHFVTKVTNAAGETAYEADSNGQPAFDGNADKSRQIAGNVTEALKPVIQFSNLKCPSGHECAGKTGTQQYDPKATDPASYADRNAQTWMVGYTPSVSAAAWVGGDGNQALHDKNNQPIFGSTIAGPMWQKFMQLYLNGKPGEKFGSVKRIGGDTAPTQSQVATTDEPTQPESTEPTRPSRPGTSEPTSPKHTPPPTHTSSEPPTTSKTKGHGETG